MTETAQPTSDPFRKQRIAWFLGMNLIAILAAVGVFVGVLYGHGLNALFRPLLDGIFEYKVVAVLIAMSPLLASCLVGMAYAQRALARKRAQAAVLPPAPSPST